ncbi:hypothetical protein [Aliarcobacter butzleri]|uniref:hypothetical protein n=1 Tax=Aliarcobacter butzleri TaxID=28197 RepID=UPI0021B279F0|nr:hypothetical protein [Aliarcobacter butzleri]MCT7632107.1 hypothetical protein [Aliarcobacter butzleri]
MNYKLILNKEDFDHLESLYSLKIDITNKDQNIVEFTLNHSEEDLEAILRDMSKTIKDTQIYRAFKSLQA